jgi:ribosomal protein L16/L10AE
LPKRGVIKFKKYHKKRVSGISAIKIQNCPDTPITEIVLIEPIRVTVKHTNAVRKSVRRLVKKQGRLNRLLLNF